MTDLCAFHLYGMMKVEYDPHITTAIEPCKLAM